MFELLLKYYINNKYQYELYIKIFLLYFLSIKIILFMVNRK
jgi:hypothetical protein